MLAWIKSKIKELSVEDKIVLCRFIAGLVYGLIIYILLYYFHPLYLNPYAWAFSVIAYYFTVLYVLFKYAPGSRFQLYLRGLATFYGTWILLVIILYELTMS